jgi:hypothetical protein
LVFVAGLLEGRVAIVTGGGGSLAYPNITLRSYEVLLDGDKVKVRL